jgi:WD40 repeat protein/serine/threonine protein kinase
MKPEDAEPLDESFLHWLAEYDEALAADRTPTPLPEPRGATPGRARVRRAQACLQRLEQDRRQRSAGPRANGLELPPLQGLWFDPSTHEGELDRFRLLRVLGTGGFGIVYLAEDPLLGRLVALKVPRPQALLTPELRQRFLREARAAARLNHPNIVPIFDTGEVGLLCYIVSGYSAGGTLAQWLKARVAPVPVQGAARLVALLADAVQHAHEHGILHRDLKPSNILLEPAAKASSNPSEDLGLLPRLTDFGLARLRDGEPAETSLPPGEGDGLVPGNGEETPAGALLGTPKYMAPEQAGRRSEAVGAATDVYALGVILYELLTGRTPFEGETSRDTLRQVLADEPLSPCRLRPGVPRDLETVCLKCLHKEPSQRYASALELADDLHRFLKGEPIRARPLGPVGRLWRWCRRQPRLAAASGLAAAAVVAVVGLAIGFALHRSAAAERLRLEQEQTEAALRESRLHLTTLAFERGLSLCAQGEVDGGLHWLARSLRDAPAGADDLRHAIRVNLASWSRHLRFPKLSLPHPASVQEVAFSPDGRTILTGCEDQTARLWEAGTGRPIGAPLPQGGELVAAAFSSDGETILTASQVANKGSVRGETRLWEVATGRPLGPALTHPCRVSAAALSPDGKLVLTGCQDHTARLWETATGRPVGAPLPHPGPVQAVAFSPNGQSILTGCHLPGAPEGQAQLWNAATGEPLGPPLAHRGGVRAVAFSSDGKMLLTGSMDNAARLWDAVTGKLISPPLMHRALVSAVAFSPDGKTVLTGSHDRTARLWETGTAKPQGSALPHQGEVTAVAFCPSGGAVLTGAKDQSARLWDTAAGRVFRLLFPHEHGVRAVAFSPDGKMVVTASLDHSARLWDAASGEPLGAVLRHKHELLTAAFSPDGQTVLTGSMDKTARLWSAPVGNELFRLTGHVGWVVAVAFSPDGQTILTGSLDGSARFWDARTGRYLGRSVRHPQAIYALAFSPDGQTILTGSHDQTARLWNAATGAPIGLALTHQGPVRAVAFSPDGRTVLTGSADRTARLWDAATGTPRGSPLTHDGPVRSVAFSPDGRTVLTGSADRTARLWDAATGTSRGPPLSHSGPVSTVAFSPDGRTVLTGSEDHTARLWDAATGVPIGPPLPHEGRITALAFSPDGTLVLTGSEDRNGRLWGPISLKGDVERVLLWVEVITAKELDAQGVLRDLDTQTLHQRRVLLAEVGGPPL